MAQSPDPPRSARLRPFQQSPGVRLGLAVFPRGKHHPHAAVREPRQDFSTVWMSPECMSLCPSQGPPVLAPVSELGPPQGTDAGNDLPSRSSQILVGHACFISPNSLIPNRVRTKMSPAQGCRRQEAKNSGHPCSPGGMLWAVPRSYRKTSGEGPGPHFSPPGWLWPVVRGSSVPR